MTRANGFRMSMRPVQPCVVCSNPLTRTTGETSPSCSPDILMLDSGAGTASRVSSPIAAVDYGSNCRALKLFMAYSAFSELDQRFDVVAANPLHRARGEAQQLQFLEFGARMMDGTLGAKKN